MNFAQLTLNCVHISAIMQRNVRGQTSGVIVATQILGHERDTLNTFGRHLLRDLSYRDRAIDCLPAGHRDGVVIKNFVGDIHLGGNGGAYSQIARMKIRAIAKILKHMRHLGESSLTDPRCTFATHLRGELVEFGINRRSHHMTANAGQRETAFGHFGGGVVRTARAVVGGAGWGVDGLVEYLFFGFEEGEACLDQITGVKACNP